MKYLNSWKGLSSFLLLSTLLASFIITPTVLADGTYTWTNETSGTGLHGLAWESIASSSTGQKLAAVASGGDIYTSSNYGVSWTDVTPSGSLHNKNWIDITSSATGQYLTAAIELGNVYSSSDYGTTWTSDSGISGHDWQTQGLASSSSGQYQAASNNGGIYISSDYGATWTSESASGPTSGLYITSVAISASGQNLVGVADSVGGGHIFTSTNYGVTWTDRGNNANWESVTSNSSGQYLTAGSNGGQLYTSSNYGVNWTDVTPVAQGWQTVTASSSGQYQAAGGSYNGDIYISSDYGATWTDDTSANALHNRYWNSLAMNSTGQHIAAVEVGADIYNGNEPTLAPPKPGITNQNVTMTVNGSVTVDVLSGVNGNPDPSTLTIVSGPAHGKGVDPPSTITYTPDPGYTGSDSLVFQVCSSLDNTVCSQATLSFNVANALKAPNTGFGSHASNTANTIIICGTVSGSLLSLALARSILRTNQTRKNH